MKKTSPPSQNARGDTLKISGKRFTLPEGAASEWKFERRPGGWLIATSQGGARIRLAASEHRAKLSFLFARSPSSGGGHGEVIERSHSSGRASDSPAAVAAELTAQFPGKVRKVLVAAGARVLAGDPLLLIEAMKMEFAIRAPVPGTVTRVRVSEGQQLQPGEQFVDFEPEHAE